MHLSCPVLSCPVCSYATLLTCAACLPWPSSKLGCCGSTYTNAPRAQEALQPVIGRDEHLRAAAEMATAGHTWRAHAGSFSYLSGTHYACDAANRATPARYWLWLVLLANNVKSATRAAERASCIRRGPINIRPGVDSAHAPIRILCFMALGSRLRVFGHRKVLLTNNHHDPYPLGRPLHHLQQFPRLPRKQVHRGEMGYSTTTSHNSSGIRWKVDS